LVGALFSKKRRGKHSKSEVKKKVASRGIFEIRTRIKKKAGGATLCSRVGAANKLPNRKLLKDAGR